MILELITTHEILISFVIVFISCINRLNILDEMQNEYYRLEFVFCKNNYNFMFYRMTEIIRTVIYEYFQQETQIIIYLL